MCRYISVYKNYTNHQIYTKIHINTEYAIKMKSISTQTKMCAKAFDILFVVVNLIYV